MAKQTQTEEVERASACENDRVVRVHAKTIIAVVSINFLYFAQLVAVVGSGLLAQAMTQLLGGTSQTVWFSSIINILTLALSPPVTQAADYWGRKWLLVICSAFGCVGAIVVARAQSIAGLIAGFCLIGVTYGSQALLHAVVSEVIPRRQRPLAQASVNITAAVGAIIGIVMGGSLVRHGNLENYRIYWYVTAGALAATALGVTVAYNPPKRELEKSLTHYERLKRLDWIGYALFVPGLILFCIALSWSNNPYRWRDVEILAPFIVGIVMMTAFFVYELRFESQGVLHHHLFQNSNFAISLCCIAIEGLFFFTTNSYFVYQTSVFTQSDLLIAGLHFAVLFATTLVFAFLAGSYSTHFKAIKAPIIVGFTAFLIFNILMATTTLSSPANVFWGFPVVAGAGLGIILPLVMVAAQLSTPPELISLASGLVIAARAVGATIGLAVNNAIFNSAMTENVPKKIAAAVLPLGLPESSLPALIAATVSHDADALDNIDGATPNVITAAAQGLLDAYAIAFRNAWIAGSCFCFAALVASFFYNVHRNKFSFHIDAPVEEILIETQTRLDSKQAAAQPETSVSAPSEKCEA